MISETTRISDALIRMQREHVHMSLIIDEYGGTAVFNDGRYFRRNRWGNS